MKNYILFLLVLFSGCVIKTEDLSESETQETTSEDHAIYFSEDETEGDSCAPSYETIELPNGERKLVLLPSLCNPNYINLEDPKTEELKDPTDLFFTPRVNNSPEL